MEVNDFYTKGQDFNTINQTKPNDLHADKFSYI